MSLTLTGVTTKHPTAPTVARVLGGDPHVEFLDGANLPLPDVFQLLKTLPRDQAQPLGMALLRLHSLRGQMWMSTRDAIVYTLEERGL